MKDRILKRFQDELAAVYRDTGAGKAAVPPALMAMGVLVQGYLGASDAEIVELTVVDLRSFLGAGRAQLDRHARILLAASRDVPTALVVDEVLGFRRFAEDDHDDAPPPTVIRCEHYLKGGFRRGAEVWPRFSLPALLDDEQFLNAGERAGA